MKVVDHRDLVQRMDTETRLDELYVERSVQLKASSVTKRWLVASDALQDRGMFSDIFGQCANQIDAGKRWFSRELTAESVDATALGWVETENGQSVSEVRLYVQRWERLVEKLNAGIIGPIELYKGLKASHYQRGLTEDQYLCYPNLAIESMRAQMLKIGGEWTSTVINWLMRLPNMSSELLRYCEIQGSGGRKSWLVTLHKYPVTNDQWLTLAEVLSVQTGYDVNRYNDGNESLVHVSGGLTNDREDYVNLYFESSRQRLIAA